MLQEFKKGKLLNVLRNKEKLHGEGKNTFERFDLGLKEYVTFGKHWKTKESFVLGGKGRGDWAVPYSVNSGQQGVIRSEGQ